MYDMQPIMETLDRAFSVLTDKSKEKVCIIQDIQKAYHALKGRNIGPKAFDELYDMEIPELQAKLNDFTRALTPPSY